MSLGLDVEVARLTSWQEGREGRMKGGRKGSREGMRGGPQGPITSSQELGWRNFVPALSC